MKILFISEAKSIHTQKWVMSISSVADQVHLVSSSSVTLPGIILHQRNMYSANPIKTLYNVFEIRRLINAIKPDIVQVCGLFSINSFFLLPLLVGLKQLVISPWGSDIIFIGSKESFLSKYIKKYLLHRATILTASSHFLLSHMRLYAQKKHIEYIPFGVDAELFKPSTLEKADFHITIGITKNLNIIYGHKYLLEAIPTVLKAYPLHTIEVKIIGSGVEERTLKNLVQELNIQNNVLFVKHVTDQKTLQQHMQSFDIFAMPTVIRPESLGVAAIEAAAMQIPVVASKIGGIPEVVSDSITGFLVEPANSKQIASALITLIGDKHLRLRMGVAGRKLVLEKYQWNDCVDRMKKIYQQLGSCKG